MSSYRRSNRIVFNVSSYVVKLIAILLKNCLIISSWESALCYHRSGSGAPGMAGYDARVLVVNVNELIGTEPGD